MQKYVGTGINKTIQHLRTTLQRPYEASLLDKNTSIRPKKNYNQVSELNKMKNRLKTEFTIDKVRND